MTAAALSPLPARARDRRRAALAELAGDPFELTTESVPDVQTPAEREWWIAELLVQGRWRTDHKRTIAQVWGCSERTVQEYAGVAADFVRMLTGDTEALAELAATRIAKLSALAEDERTRLDASKLILQLTGHLKGGAEVKSMTEAEREQAIVESIRDPNESMVRMLRQAFADPGDGLRALLAEMREQLLAMAVVETEGTEDG